MKNHINKIIVFLIICMLPLFFSCKSSSSAQRQKQVETQREDKDRQAEKMYDEGKEKHLKNQTSQTRKRMKINKRNAEKSGYANKRPCFIKRWFTKKPKNTCPKS